MQQPSERWQLPTEHVGREVLVYDRVDSSNSLALGMIDDGLANGTALLAHEQSAGRGQYGRVWQAPPGSSVLMSIVLHPPALLQRPALLTAFIAVGVSATIRDLLSCDATIKWPNDILLQGKKVCGILIEQRSRSGQTPFTVAGLGLNVNQPAECFELAGLPDAGSLYSLTGAVLTAEDVARNLLHTLDRLYAGVILGNRGDLEESWRKGLGLLGCSVRVELPQGSCVGILREIAFDGLVLETRHETRVLQPENIRHIHRA